MLTSVVRGNQILLASLIAIAVVSASPRETFAGPQKDAVCQGSCGGGCGPCSGSGSSYSGGGGNLPQWGGYTERYMDKAKECPNFGCAIMQVVVGLPIGFALDAPYYAIKGVGYGLFYGGKGLRYGLYYGAAGIGKGVAYIGTSIGHAVAAPFHKRPAPPKRAAEPSPAIAILDVNDAVREQIAQTERTSIDTAPILLDDRSELRKKFDDDFVPAAKRAADLAAIADTHREGLAMSAELVGAAKVLDEKLGHAFRGVALIDAAVTAYEGNTAGAGGKVVGIGIGMIAKGPAYAGQFIASSAKNAMLGMGAGVYMAQGMAADEAVEMAAKDYDTLHKNEDSAQTRFFWGITGL